MNFYKLNNDYLDYLRQFEKHIYFSRDNKENRKYVGVVLNINKIDYYAPLTHVVNKNYNTDFYIYDKKNNKKIAAIKLNNMIPIINNNLLARIDINIKKTDTEEEKKYKALLNIEKKYINNNKNILYKIAKDNYKNIYHNPTVFNYKLLEEKCKLYIPEFYIYQDKEQSKLVVFTEEKKEDRYNLYGIAEVPKDLIGNIRNLKQLSDKTIFSLIDENNKNLAFYSTILKKVYETIDKLNEEVQSISQ